jgi:hypothetical protein
MVRKSEAESGGFNVSGDDFYCHFWIRCKTIPLKGRRTYDWWRRLMQRSRCWSRRCPATAGFKFEPLHSQC